MNLLVQCSVTSFFVLSPILLYSFKKINSITFYLVFGIVCLVAFVLPLIFRFSLALQRGVLYLYFLDNPFPDNLKYPEHYDLTNGRNVYLYNGEIKLGVWHLLPSSFEDTANYTEEDFDEALGKGLPIFVYLHGNLGSRASDHRLKLYELLNNLDCHVITFDYRCFGDSTYGTPHETALVSDGEVVYRWAFELAKGSPVFVWGHSIGAGLTTNMLARVTRTNQAPKGVVLEAPFDDMPSEIKVHPFGTVFRYLPWYEFLFSRPYFHNDEGFNSSKYILEYPSPTLILHAEDDGIIPSFLGEKLYTIGKKRRKKTYGPVAIKIFESQFQYGHTNICEAPEIPDIIQTFIDNYKDEYFNR